MQPVLGLINASNMSLEWNGPTAQLQQADGGDGPAGPHAARVNGVIDETGIKGILTSFKQRDGRNG